MNDRPLLDSKLKTVREAIRSAADQMDDPSLIINADANTTHQSVIRVMDAARQASLSRIAFTTRALDGE